MKELTVRLQAVPDSYYDFVVAVLTYVKKKQSRMDKVSEYLDNNPNATTSDILWFISNQEDFFEDAVYDGQPQAV
ncbi:MAG: hypothetical protein J5872_02835 [Lachnospiraceae bacterium]|nr:hypothetical protein [Lachnospiraceae bacterium]